MVNLAKTINKMINKRKKMIFDGHFHHACTITFSNKKYCKKGTLR